MDTIQGKKLTSALIFIALFLAFQVPNVFSGESLNLSESNVLIDGKDSGDYVGFVTEALGDINGDQYADFALATRLSASNDYTVGIFFGRPSSQVWPSQITIDSADLTLKSSVTGFAYQIRGKGDINGDGFDDFAIQSDIYGWGGYFIILGRPTSAWPSGEIEVTQIADVKIEEGQQISISGDYNGDGNSDIAVGTYYNHLYIFLGRRDGWPKELLMTDADVSYTPPSTLIASVSFVADLNMDGYDELVIGCPQTSDGDLSDVYVFQGNPNASLTPICILNNTAYNEKWGELIAPAGDVNADHYPDFFAGAQYIQVVSMIQGGPTLENLIVNTNFLVHSQNNYKDVSLSSSHGDFDGDGIDDVMLSDDYYSDEKTSGGIVFLLRGRKGGWNSTFDLSGNYDLTFLPESYNHTGAAISHVGDIDNDRKSDFLIGAPNQGSMGRAYLVLADNIPCLNYLMNSSANQGTEYWYTFGKAGTATEADGNNVFQLSNEGELFDQFVDVPINSSNFNVSALIKCANGNVLEGFPYITLALYDESGVKVRSISCTPSKATNWTSIELNCAIDPSIKISRARVLLKRSALSRINQVNTAYFDEIKLKINCES